MSGRVLVVIRHAKAVAEAPTDAQRPLADRGLRDAEAAGRWLAEHDITPDLAVVSPATRTRQTWDQIAAGAPANEVRYDERIYDNSVELLLELVGEVADDVTTLVLVGHNPSMHGLAITLDDGSGDAAARAAIHDGYPTCAITVFDVSRTWAELAHGDAKLRTFSVPRG